MRFVCIYINENRKSKIKFASGVIFSLPPPPPNKMSAPLILSTNYSLNYAVSVIFSNILNKVTDEDAF